MKFSRWSAVPVLLVAGALVCSSCSGVTSGSTDPVASSDTASGAVDCAGKPGLRASGSTAQASAIDQFVYAYARACPGRTLGYTANGSPAGLEDFVTGATDLAGSDASLDPAKGQPERAEARCGSPAWHLPTVFSPIAISYRISGVDALNLDGPTAAKIFSGGITSWDHPAIKALNPGSTLPSTPIHVVFHSDKSETTATFQGYLDDASDGAWGGATGETFTGVGEGAVGSNAASALVQSTDGAISYQEWSSAVGKRLHIARIITPAGSGPVSISAEAVAKTIDDATFMSLGNDLVLDPSSLHQPTTPGAYPIVLTSYEIVCSKYPDDATGAAVKAFLQAAIGSGQDGLDQYGSIPLPESLRSKLLTAVNAIS